MATTINFTDLSEEGADAPEFRDCHPPQACIYCLRASTLADELTDDQVDRLCGVVEIVRLPKGEVLISEGDYDDRVYAIAAGEMEVTRQLTPSREVTLGTIAPRRIVGELAFLDGLKRTATVKAKGNACVITLRREKLEELIAQDPWLVYRIMRSILRSAHRTVDKLDVSYSDFIRYVSG